MKRRIKSPGFIHEFMGIDSFVKSTVDSDYDVIFVDECSTIDNRTMVRLLEKVGDGSLLVLAGDIYQIESISFGNWFAIAKSAVPNTSVFELTHPYRSSNSRLQELWNNNDAPWYLWK